MSDFNEQDNDLKTIQINDTVYFDVYTNTIVLLIDRITVTVSIEEFLKLSNDIKNGILSFKNYLSIVNELNKVPNTIIDSNNYIKDK